MTTAAELQAALRRAEAASGAYLIEAVRRAGRPLPGHARIRDHARQASEAVMTLTQASTTSLFASE